MILRRTLARTLVSLTLISAPWLVGCQGTTPTPPKIPTPEGIRPAVVRDADFSATALGVLKDGGSSPERLSRLHGVVKRQLAHAALRFKTGHTERAMESVVGALYLLRAGEGPIPMLDADELPAVLGAVERASHRGDEGRAMVLLKLAVASTKPGSPERKKVEQHLASLERWASETRTGGPLAQIGLNQRYAATRAMIDPTGDATEVAESLTASWIEGSLQANERFQKSGERPPRGEAVEAARGLSSGGITMMALRLRHGDAKGALRAVDKSPAREVLPVPIFARLEDVAEHDDARSWLGLAAMFLQYELSGPASETSVQPELVSGALWGTALEAYRKNPQNLDAARLLGRQLVQLGLSEVAPLVLDGALGERPATPRLAAAMDVLISAVGADAQIDDVDAARRTMAGASGILALADKTPLPPDVLPSRARMLLASAELRAGNLVAAKALLVTAADAERSIGAYTMLAMVERQGGDSAAALGWVDKALAAVDARVRLAEVADAHLVAFEIHRDGSRADKARASLDSALQAALAARQSAPGPVGLARAERVLGRVLDGYGEQRGAARAFERALQLAQTERSALGSTMLEAVLRAVVRRDLPSARAALKLGVEAGVEADDLVYAGLWAHLLERELKVQGDGTTEQAMKAGQQRGAWTSKLVSWATGRLSDTELRGAANNAVQRTEVDFYLGMASRIAGAGDDGLKKVAASPILELLEVQLARELLAPKSASPALPKGLALP